MAKKVLISADKITEKGRQLYYRLQPRLLKKFDPSYYVSLEVKSGDYFVGQTTVASLEKAQKKHPRRKFFVAQIGRLAGFLK